MLENFSIENFKCYEGRYDFHFPGLTYLTGANNSGKSSVIQALYMLAASNSSNLEPSLILNKEGHYNFGNYSNVLNKNCSNKDSICFELNGDNYNILLKYKNNEIENYNPELSEMQIELADKKKKCISYSFSRNNSNTEDLGKMYKWNMLQNGREQEAGDAVIMGFTPEMFPLKITRSSLEDIISFRTVFSTIQTSSIKYLKAYRIEGKPYYLMKGSSIRDIGITGEYTAEAVYKMIQGNKTIKFEKKEPFYKVFQEWFKRILGSSYSLIIESHEGSLKIKIEEELSKKQKYNITEAGFGFSQIIPIIAMILLSNENDILLIENPEVHLHPKLQANLAELFVYAVKHGRKLIVETHSEHIINRTRLLVKQDKAPAKLTKKINLYFFEKVFENNETYIRNEEIKIEQSGKLSNWPKDFFDQYYYDGLKLIK